MMNFTNQVAEVTPFDLIIVKVLVALGCLAAAVIVKRMKQMPAKRRPAAAARPAPFRAPTHPLIQAPPGAVAPVSVIDSVRQLLGPPPRTFDSSLTQYLTVVPPIWLEGHPDDEQWLNVQSQERLRREGRVVWATIAQANSNLFERNNLEAGASVIYSPDPWFDTDVKALALIAHQCFELKGTDPADPESATFARMLTNELIRAMGLKVPSIFTGGRKVYHSSMLVPRKHLPKGYLSGSYFPVWIDAKKPGPVVMVPAAYWPASLTRAWDRDL